MNLNGVPLVNFLAANQDPAAPGRPLPPDFLRPFPGLGNINYFTYDASSAALEENAGGGNQSEDLNGSADYPFLT